MKVSIRFGMGNIRLPSGRTTERRGESHPPGRYWPGRRFGSGGPPKMVKYTIL